MNIIVNRLTSIIKMLIYTHIGKIDSQTVLEKKWKSRYMFKAKSFRMYDVHILE